MVFAQSVAWSAEWRAGVSYAVWALVPDRFFMCLVYGMIDRKLGNGSVFAAERIHDIVPH